MFASEFMTKAAHLNETAALLALLDQPGASWRAVTDLVEEAGSALHVLRHGAPDEQPSLFAANEDARGADLAAIGEQIAAWGSEGISVWTVLDDEYPANLRTVYDRPPLVFVAGALDDRDARSVAVVGTRGATDEGLARARRVSRHLVDHDFTVLSGLAAGIDTAAHTAALEAGGRTVAVIGTGLHRSYPNENAALQAQIAQKTAVVSQFLPDAPPTKSSFPMRNAVMSGMALATVVVEAGQTSGARMQAGLALKHNRPVFLLHSLLEHEWAQVMQDRAGVHVVDEPTQITDTIERLTSPALLTA